MEELKVNHAKKEIQLSKSYSKKASIYDSAEYKKLIEIRKSFPDYMIIVKASDKRKHSKDSFKGLNYQYMESYIQKSGKIELLNEFNNLRKGTEINSPVSYGKIKKWFLNNFPEIRDYQKTCEQILNSANPQDVA